MPKRFFWIKLKDSFFKQLAIKKLRKVAGGDTHVIIYLKMMLLAMNDEGRISYECNDEAEFAENLALELDEQEDNVKLTLAFLKGQKLIEFIADTEVTEVFLPEVENCIGSESDSAERVRKHRSIKSKLLQCNTDVTNVLQGGNENVTLEKEIDIEKDKDKDIDIEKESKTKGRTRTKKTAYASSVRLSDEEYQGFVEQYGDNIVAQMIEILNNYKESTGKTYKSDAAAMRSWVVSAYFERSNKNINKGSKNNIVEAEQELARRVGEDANDNNANNDSSVWGVWASK